ncbi:hypothetical protein SAMN05421780_108185 [Flexibacter flexilis DSM 6793]|uniref:Uncharacterized protein n=1 Tax=Flexibacter flexilis DSM 6793 TaxID=927664 RepID=A0A1I1LDC9_9BACT|nr:hypothetical protein [Flexibacter flexilis]SFC71147.1 hypothetical protein SAMN05421780_108185 [Flexibacter flexilis DSM 6793]
MAFSFQKFPALVALAGKTEISAEDIAKVNNELSAQGITGMAFVAQATANKAAGYDTLKQQLDAAIADNTKLKADDKTQALADLQTKYEAAQAEIKKLGKEPGSQHSNPLNHQAEDDGSKPDAQVPVYASTNFTLNQIAEDFHNRK